MKKYVYIFTRQDLSPEQIVVQSSHVTMKMGYYLGKSPKSEDPDTTHFVLVGVRNEEALLAVVEILTSFNYQYEVFIESDEIGVTSVSTYPIDEDKKGILQAFNLMKMGR